MCGADTSGGPELTQRGRGESENTLALKHHDQFSKEGWIKSVLVGYHTQKQALSRFFLGAMALSDPVVEVIRRELRRVSPDVRIEIDQIRHVLSSEVLKREVMEGDKAEEAVKKIARVANKALRAKATKESTETAVVQGHGATPRAASSEDVPPPTLAA